MSVPIPLSSSRNTAALTVPLVLALVHLVDGRDGVLPGPAGGAVALLGLADRRQHPFDAEVSERVDADVLADLLDRVVGRDQVLGVREVDPVVAAVLRGRAGDVVVDLLGGGV